VQDSEPAETGCATWHIHQGRAESQRSVGHVPQTGRPARHDQPVVEGSRTRICQRTVGEASLPGYGPVTSSNRPVRTRMPGGEGRGGEKPPLTRLGNGLVCSISYITFLRPLSLPLPGVVEAGGDLAPFLFKVAGARGQRGIGEFAEDAVDAQAEELQVLGPGVPPVTACQVALLVPEGEGVDEQPQFVRVGDQRGGLPGACIHQVGRALRDPRVRGRCKRANPAPPFTGRYSGWNLRARSLSMT